MPHPGPPQQSTASTDGTSGPPGDPPIVNAGIAWVMLPAQQQWVWTATTDNPLRPVDGQFFTPRGQYMNLDLERDLGTHRYYSPNRHPEWLLANSANDRVRSRLSVRFHRQIAGRFTGKVGRIDPQQINLAGLVQPLLLYQASPGLLDRQGMPQEVSNNARLLYQFDWDVNTFGQEFTTITNLPRLDTVVYSAVALPLEVPADQFHAYNLWCGLARHEQSAYDQVLALADRPGILPDVPPMAPGENRRNVTFSRQVVLARPPRRLRGPPDPYALSVIVAKESTRPDQAYIAYACVTVLNRHDVLSDDTNYLPAFPGDGQYQQGFTPIFNPWSVRNFHQAFTTYQMHRIAQGLAPDHRYSVMTGDMEVANIGFSVDPDRIRVAWRNYVRSKQDVVRQTLGRDLTPQDWRNNCVHQTRAAIYLYWKLRDSGSDLQVQRYRSTRLIASKPDVGPY